MAITLQDNLKIQNQKQNVERDSVKLISDFKTIDTRFIPPVFHAMCEEDGCLYLYDVNNVDDATLGKWRKFESGGNPSLQNEITASTDLGLVKEGKVYPMGTPVEDILKELLSGKTLATDSFYYGTSDTRTIISLYQLTGSTNSVCNIVSDNKYIVFGVLSSLGIININDSNGFNYNNEYDVNTITHNGETYDIYVSKNTITTDASGFEYRLTFA